MYKNTIGRGDLDTLLLMIDTFGLSYRVQTMLITNDNEDPCIEYMHDDWESWGSPNRSRCIAVILMEITYPI